MYNLRYHIATIAGIFLALALGLLLGAALGGSEALRSTSTTMVEGLRADFDEMRKEQTKLETQLADQEVFTDDLVNTWAQGRLDGAQIVVLGNQKSSIATELVTSIVKDSGGSVAKISINVEDFSFSHDATLKKEVTDLLGSKVDDNAFGLSVARALVVEWNKADLAEAEPKNDSGALSNIPLIGSTAISTEEAWKKHMPLTTLLIERDAITVEGGIATIKGVDGIVDVAIKDDMHATEAGLTIAAVSATANIPSLVTQVGGQDEVLLLDGQSRGYSGIAAVDTAVGHYGVIAILTGAEKGTFGLATMKGYPDIPDESPFNRRSSGLGSEEATAAIQESATQTAETLIE